MAYHNSFWFQLCKIYFGLLDVINMSAFTSHAFVDPNHKTNNTLQEGEEVSDIREW